jgi:hypothetical protein
VTVGVAALALAVSAEGNNRAERLEKLAAVEATRALADRVVFQDIHEFGPSLGNSKPAVEETFVVANFGQLPIEDVRVEARGGADEYTGRPTAYVTEFGVIGPCQVASMAIDGNEDPRVVFTDANGRRWSRAPAAAPRPAIARRDVIEISHSGRLRLKTLRSCQQ